MQTTDRNNFIGAPADALLAQRQVMTPWDGNERRPAAALRIPTFDYTGTTLSSGLTLKRSTFWIAATVPAVEEGQEPQAPW